MDDFHRWMWLLPVAAQAAAAARIAVGRATRKHSFLLALIISMLVVEAVGNAAAGRMSPYGYFRFWLAGYLANVSLVALALTEACTRSTESYDRFGKASQRITRAILIGSGIAMIVLLFVLPAPLAKHYSAYFQAQAYLGQTSLAVLGLTLLAFAKWARLRLHQNAKLAMIALTALCAAEAALGSTISASWPSARIYLGIFSAVACWGLLIVKWSSQPEEFSGGVGTGAVPDAGAASALARMEAVNRQLGELVRRS